jgi:uncharacterized protein involved in type VI secretion and phage assembly
MVRGTGEVTPGSPFQDPSQYADFLGKPLSLTIQSSELPNESGAVTAEFIGLVTQVEIDHGIDSVNIFRITAHSPTVSLDACRRNKLYHEMKSSDIIAEVLQRHSITVGNTETTSAQLPYCVQYRETDYEFVLRLASASGMFAFYDGKEFRVGKASTNNAGPQIAYGHILRGFNLGLGTATEKFSAQAYDQSKKESYAGETSGSLRASLSGLFRKSHDASKEIFPCSSFVGSLNPDSQARLDDTLEIVREGSVGKAIVCQGMSYHPQVSVGRCVRIDGLDRLNGLYFVTAIQHLWDPESDDRSEWPGYHNTFSCIPIEAAYPRHRQRRYWAAELQCATVTNTDDPDSLGRVQVKFPWYDGSAAAEPQAWLRVMTPHAGNERGFFCLPEIDDEVMVAFEHGDPDRPFIVGSMYNGVDKAPTGHAMGFSGADNDLKVFRTKTGNEIVLHDKSGSEVLALIQKDGQNKVTLMADGPKIVIESDGDISIKGKTIKLESTTGDVEVKSAGKVKVGSTTDLELKGGTNLKAEGAVNFEGKGGVEAKLGAAQVKLEGSAMTEVKGAIVKIN